MFFEENLSAIIPMVLAAIRVGTAFCSLKIVLFLASQSCQQRFFGIEAQRRPKIGFLRKEPGKREFQSLRSCAAVSGRFMSKPGGRIDLQTSREDLQ